MSLFVHPKWPCSLFIDAETLCHAVLGLRVSPQHASAGFDFTASTSTHQPADPALDEANPPRSSDALKLLPARSPKRSTQKHASATLALAGTAKRSRSAQAFEEDNASRSSSSRQAGSPSTSVPQAMNKSAKCARHSSPQSNQQAELPTASPADRLSSSHSLSPEQLGVCQCEAELPLQPDTEEEVLSNGNSEPGRLAAVKEEESEADVPVEEHVSLVDADHQEDESSSDEESAGQEPAGVNAAEKASTSEEDTSGEEEEAAQQPEHDEHSAASASSREVPASHDSAAASMESGGKSNDDQQEVPADGTEEQPGSDDSLQPQPVTNGKLSKLHWSVLLTAATDRVASVEFPSVRSLLPPAFLAAQIALNSMERAAD